jgi:hypothetical protein
MRLDQHPSVVRLIAFAGARIDQRLHDERFVTIAMLSAPLGEGEAS